MNQSFSEPQCGCTLQQRFTVRVQVDTPIVVGQDAIAGRRQLIPITSGTVERDGFSGVVLPGGVDSQVIRPNGRCDLSARYGIRLDNGASFYVENNGIRTVPQDCAADVLAGKFVDPSLYYFHTTPTFEVYDTRLAWMYDKVWTCSARRLPDQVCITFYTVE